MGMMDGCNHAGICMYVYMCVWYVGHVQVPFEPSREHYICWSSSSTGICEQPDECWELNSGPLLEQQVFSTTELPLHPLVVSIVIHRGITYSMESFVSLPNRIP